MESSLRTRRGGRRKRGIGTVYIKWRERARLTDKNGHRESNINKRKK